MSMECSMNIPDIKTATQNSMFKSKDDEKGSKKRNETANVEIERKTKWRSEIINSRRSGTPTLPHFPRRDRTK